MDSHSLHRYGDLIIFVAPFGPFPPPLATIAESATTPEGEAAAPGLTTSDAGSADVRDPVRFGLRCLSLLLERFLLVLRVFLRRNFDPGLRDLRSLELLLPPLPLDLRDRRDPVELLEDRL